MDTSNIGGYLRNLFKENENCILAIDSKSGIKYTYKEFFDLSFSIKRNMNKFGIKEGDKVAILVENNFRLLAFFLAGLLGNLRLFPIDPQKGKTEINEILNISSCKWTVLEKNFDNYCSGIIKFEDFFNYSYSSDNYSIFDSIDYEQDYMITYTSGTTGVPKGVIHNFKNYFNTSRNFGKQIGINSSHYFYHNMPMAYLGGILNLFYLPILNGAKVVVGDRFDVSKAVNFWEQPLRYNVNAYWFTPTTLALLLRLDKKNIKLGKDDCLVCVGTAKLMPSLKKEFEEKYDTDLLESYGLSETLFISTNSKNNEQVINSAGKILEGVNVKILEDNEILAKTPWMFKGYLNVDTSEYFYDEYYKTGDIGSVNKNNYVLIEDRKKDLIIKGGLNISPFKLETLLGEMNIFDEYSVVGCYDPVVGEKTVCYYVDRKGSFNNKTKGIILNRVLNDLGRAYTIDEFIKIDSIPKNINGKIDKKLLRLLN